MSCFLSTLYVPHQLFTGSPGYQPALTNPPYVVSGIHPVTICVRHLGQSIASSKGRFLLVLASCSREHFSLPNRTDVILHPRIKVQRPSRYGDSSTTIKNVTVFMCGHGLLYRR